MMLTRRYMMTIGAAAAAFGPGGASAGTAVTGGSAFGGIWRVVTSDAEVAGMRAAIIRIVAEVDSQMSPYKPESALSRFNRSQSTDWQDVPGPLARVAEHAISMSLFTGGVFDPRVGPLVHRMGFGPISGHGEIGGQVEAVPGALRKTQSGLTLDLCGIAKGHALDRMFDALKVRLSGPFLIELGGEVRAHGQHPSGRSWQVAIEDPTPGAFTARHIVAPGHLALATSGHSANGVTGSVSTSHIIDPRVRRSAVSPVASVSVLAETAERADALATALCAMGERGAGFARRHGIDALFLLSGGAVLETVTTGAFADHLMV